MNRGIEDASNDPVHVRLAGVFVEMIPSAPRHGSRAGDDGNADESSNKK